MAERGGTGGNHCLTISVIKTLIKHFYPGFHDMRQSAGAYMPGCVLLFFKNVLVNFKKSWIGTSV